MSAINVSEDRCDNPRVEVISKPSLDDVPNGRGVLVKVLRVGVDGTGEIRAGEYDTPPPSYDFLVFGHAGFGRVENVGPNVTEMKPGDYVVASSRRPYAPRYDQYGNEVVSHNGTDDGQGLNLLTEYYVADAQFTAKVPDDLWHVGGLLEPSPTGNVAISGRTSALLFQAIDNGISISPLSLNPRLPGKLEEIISKLLNKNGKLCYQGAEEFRSLLARLRGDIGRSATKTLRATLAWRKPGARWYFAPAGRSCVTISVLSEAAHCGIAPGLMQGTEGRLGLHWLRRDSPRALQL